MKKIKLYILFFVCFLLAIPAHTAGNDNFFNSFALETRAGIAPTVWRSRDNFSAISCTAVELLGLQAPVIPLFELPQFHTVFKLPWIVGGRIGYQPCPYFQIYLESNYRHAQGKRFDASNAGNGVIVLPNLIDTITFSVAMGSYSAVDAYIGMRYYSDACWCDAAAFFIGGKFGLLHHKKVNFAFTTNSTIVPNPTGPFISSSLPFFLSHTAVAGGMNIGVAVEVGCNLDLMIAGELVATCGPKANAIIPFDLCTTSIAINPNLVPNAFLIGGIGTEIFFPITIGLNYNF